MMANRHFYIRMGDTIVRQATPSDYQAVMDIDDNIYDGRDYMPLMFHQFLQSKQHLMLVTEYEGKIIGLVNYRFSDNESQVTAMSGRLEESRRGARVMDRQQLFLKLVELFPHLSKTMFVTKSCFINSRLDTKLYQWDVLLFRFSAQLLSARLAAFRSSTISRVTTPESPRQLTYQMVDTLLTSGDRLERFFKFNNQCGDYVAAQWHWRPMKINKVELKELFATASWALITDDINDGDVKLDKDTSDSRCVMSTATRVGTIRSLSYSYIYPVKIGLFCVVSFFGDDPQVAARHAIGHAEHLATIWNGYTHFMLQFPEDLNRDVLDAGVQSVLGSHFQTMSLAMGVRSVSVPESRL